MIRPIPDFPGYSISDDGCVYSPAGHQPGRVLVDCLRKLKPFKTGSGYLSVYLYRDGVQSRRKVHRLVLETFVGPCPEGMEACHNNGIKMDNRLENLRWGTKPGNFADMRKHGTNPGKPQTANGFFYEQLRKGIISRGEYNKLVGDSGGLSDAAPDTSEMRHFEDLVVATAQELGWPLEDADRLLRLRCAEVGITIWHVEVYSNYPAFSEGDLARVFGVSRNRVHRAIARVRQALPGLRSDTSACNTRGASPTLRDMLRIECSDTTDWLDEDKIRQKF